MRFILVTYTVLLFVKTASSKLTSQRFPNLHMSMNVRDLIYYFNVDNYDDIPPYEVIAPRHIRGYGSFHAKTNDDTRTNAAKMEFFLDLFQARYKVYGVRNTVLIDRKFQVIHFKSSRRNFTNYRVSQPLLTCHYLAKVVHLGGKQNQNGSSLVDRVNGAFSVISDGIHGSFRISGQKYVVKPFHPELLRKMSANSTQRGNFHIAHATSDSYPKMFRGATREVREFVKNVIQKGESIKNRQKRRAVDNANRKGHTPSKQTHKTFINLKPIDTGIHLAPILLSADVEEKSDARSVEIFQRLKTQKLDDQEQQRTQHDHRQHGKKFPRKLLKSPAKIPGLGTPLPRSHVQKFLQHNTHAKEELKKSTRSDVGKNSALNPNERSHVQKFPALVTHQKNINQEIQTGAEKTHVDKFGNLVDNEQITAQRNHVQKFPGKDTNRPHVQKFPSSGLGQSHVQKFPNKDVRRSSVHTAPSSHADRERVQKHAKAESGASRHVQKFRDRVRDPEGQHIPGSPASAKSLLNHVQKFPVGETVPSSASMTDRRGSKKHHTGKFTHVVASSSDVKHSAVKADDAVRVLPKFSSSTVIDSVLAEFPPVPESRAFPFLNSQESSKTKTGPLQVSLVLGVIVDYSMYSTMLNFGLADQEQQLFYILSLYNEVQAFYKEPSFAENIRFTLSLKSVGFITEENNDFGADPFVPQYWENLCQGPYNLDDYDHLQALTMLDLFDLPSEQNQRERETFNFQFDAKIRKPPRKGGQFQPKTSGMKASNKMKDSVGMALLGSTCSKTSHCSVVEMSSVAPSLSVADELAHSMGANHEGANGCPIAENPSSFLISPSETKSGWTQFAQLPVISACAIQEMVAFFKHKGSCLLKAPPSPGEGLEFRKALKGILHRPFSADGICKLQAGPVFLKMKKWKHLVITAEEGNIPGICQSLICNGIDGTDYAGDASVFVFGPAPTGTTCNRNGHVCYNFQCVDKASIPAFYDGGRKRMIEV